MKRTLLACCLLGLLIPPVRAAGSLGFKDGDRIVLLGSTFIEREQLTGYWETAWTRHYPDKRLTFRNLGWSGDTVFGEAWASFDPVAVGFRRLRDHVLALKPTVLIIGYGTNESFAGPAGLPHFVRGLEMLLDAVSPTHARVVLLSPLRQEAMGRPLPDPAAHNNELELYTAAIHRVATKRGCEFVDLFSALGHPPASVGHLTDNGIHLTPRGYWWGASIVDAALTGKSSQWKLVFDANGKVLRADGATATTSQKPLQWNVRNSTLPLPPPPEGTSALTNPALRVLSVRDLPAGQYQLSIDGKPVVAASAVAWSHGVAITCGPEFAQAERLRKTIVEKNHLYFYRWRPENETYLFGFRRQEQGKNAVEIPRFDPLVAHHEARIAHLKMPVPHTYDLKLVSKRP